MSDSACPPLTRPAAPSLGAAGLSVVAGDVPGIPDAVLGPYGALALAFLAIIGLLRFVWVLWLEHLSATADDRRRLDEAIEGWREQTAANNRLAAAWEARNRRDAQRRRRDDE